MSRHAMRCPRRAQAAAVVLAGQLAGCGFMVKHPAAGSAITGATLAMATCELASSEHGRCAVVSGGAGALLGVAVLGALWLGTEDDDSAATTPAEDDAATRAGRRNPRRVPPPPPEPPPVAPAPVAVAPYLKATPAELYVRSGSTIVRAPAEDQAVAASYAGSPIRGPIKDGLRITILTARSRYQIGEEVRVIHVVDAPEPGHQLYVMGPKPVHGELVDGVERTPKPPAVPAPYDGRVVASPAVDYNYEITSYRFDTPGIHLIQWKLDGRDSNVLAIDVAKPAP